MCLVDIQSFKKKLFFFLFKNQYLQQMRQWIRRQSIVGWQANRINIFDKQLKWISLIFRKYFINIKTVDSFSMGMRMESNRNEMVAYLWLSSFTDPTQQTCNIYHKSQNKLAQFISYPVTLQVSYYTTTLRTPPPLSHTHTHAHNSVLLSTLTILYWAGNAAI